MEGHYVYFYLASEYTQPGEEDIKHVLLDLGKGYNAGSLIYHPNTHILTHPIIDKSMQTDLSVYIEDILNPLSAERLYLTLKRIVRAVKEKYNGLTVKYTLSSEMKGLIQAFLQQKCLIQSPQCEQVLATLEVDYAYGIITNEDIIMNPSRTEIINIQNYTCIYKHLRKKRD